MVQRQFLQPNALSAGRLTVVRADLNTATRRWGSESEIRDPKPETNPKPQAEND
jgi:hypothetical protein